MWLPCVYLCFFVALFLFSFWAFSLQISIIFCRLPHALSVNKPACVLIHFSLLLFCTAFSLVAMIVSYHSILAGCVSPLFSSVSGKKKTQTDRKCTKESRRILMKFFLALFHSENSTNCIGDFLLWIYTLKPRMHPIYPLIDETKVFPPENAISTMMPAA